MTYTAADNQADRTLERWPKRRLCSRHDLRRVFGLHRYFGINNYFVDLAFQVTRWCSMTVYNVSSYATHFDAQDELINKTHQLAWPRLWLSMMGLIVVVVVVTNRSKSRQKVEDSSKSLKGLKNLQRPSVWRNVYRNTNPPSKNSSFR